MTSALDVIQKPNSNPDNFSSETATTAAAHLIAYLKTLKLQKIFRQLSMTREKASFFIP